MDLSDPPPWCTEVGSAAEGLRNGGFSCGPFAVHRLPRSADWVELALAGRCRELWLLMQPRPGQQISGFAQGKNHEWLPLDAAGAPRVTERVRRCPIGAPGDAFWVAESHWRVIDSSFQTLVNAVDGCTRAGEDTRIYDGAACLSRVPAKAVTRELWSSMPIWASRLVLRTLESTPRRLHSITPEEAREAGFGGLGVSPRMRFLANFETAHGPRSAGDDPWMWRVRFEQSTLRP
jgi:hypothetical protein